MAPLICFAFGSRLSPLAEFLHALSVHYKCQPIPFPLVRGLRSIDIARLLSRTKFVHDGIGTPCRGGITYVRVIEGIASRYSIRSALTMRGLG
jgi:hypothetical protein